MRTTPMRPLLEVTLSGPQPVVDHYTRILFAAFDLTYGYRVDVQADAEVSPFGEARTTIRVSWAESHGHTATTHHPPAPSTREEDSDAPNATR